MSGKLQNIYMMIFFDIVNIYIEQTFHEVINPTKREFKVSLVDS